ncbi:MAG: GEVED domain-containing protein [bacterium]
MKRPIFIRIGLRAIIVAFALMLFSNTGADAAYCSPTSGYFYTGYGMRINLVQFNSVTIQKWDTQRDAKGNIMYGYPTNPASPSQPAWRQVDANNPVIKADKDKQYDMRCWGGATYIYSGSIQPENVSPSGNYYQDFAVYVDCDQNGKFEETERIGSSIGTYTFECTFKVKIPKTAKAGNTTLRVVCDYYGMGGSYMNACGMYYGEVRDFAITISGGVDAGISQITAPVPPLTEGIHTVKAMLKNYSEGTPITKVTIKWSVDGVDQTPVDWTGNLGALQSTEVTLGDYNFASKGVSSTFTILASTEKPNGEADETPLNDVSPAYSVTLPVVPGTYYVGGDNPDFATLKEAIDVVAKSGIKGSGAFIYEIRPGTYSGPFVMDNFPHGNNPFVFENDPANPGTVVLTAITNANNYVFYINNIPDVTFRNITFGVNDLNSQGGRILKITGNANNFTFENNILYGSVNVLPADGFKNALIDMQASQMNNLKFDRNTFYNGYGSLLLVNPTRNSKGLTINKNKFLAFSGRAINVEGIADGVISNNTLEASNKATLYGINVLNGTDIINNTITGIINTSATIGSGINVVHNAINTPATITSNAITNCNGVNGIRAEGIQGGAINNNNINLANSNFTTAPAGIVITNATLKTDKVVVLENTINMENGYGIDADNCTTDLLKNKLNVLNTGSKVNLRTISATGSNGMILLNEVISAGEVMELNKSSFTVAYNSTLGLGSADALTITNGSNKIYRNNFVNTGTGKAFSINALGSNVLDGNNYYSTTGTIGTVGGTSYADATQFLPIDKHGVSTFPNYVDNYSLKIVELKPELIFYTPLANINWPEGYQGAYEETTLDGKYRNGVYYIGTYNIYPVVDIYKYTKELIECAGSKDMAIICSGKANLGSQPRYQWYKDGAELPGEVSHKLSFPNFDYPTSGIYKCKVFAPGVAKPLWSGDIPVYALTLPEITDQPKEVINAQIGGTYNFSVKAHYRGLVPPYFQDYYQWYKYSAATNKNTALPQDAKFGGSTSSELVITGLEDTDICDVGDYYFVEIISQCGTIRSNPFIISQKPEVVFRDLPKDVDICPNSDVVFEAAAVAPEGFVITYSWEKDGLGLTDNAMYNGVKTSKLQILNASNAEAGSYRCIAEIASEGISVTSAPGYLTFKALPNAVAIGEVDYSIKRGNDVTFAVNLIESTKPLTIKWTYNGEVLKEGTWDIYNGNELMTLLLEAINENQAGEYICTLTNECGSKEVKFNLTVKKWDEVNSVEVVTENGYSLYTSVPNPANDNARVNYIMAKAGQVRFTLSDLSGRVLRNLYDGNAVEGMNTLEINVKTLDLPAGVYFYTMTTDKFSGVRSFVIVE